LYYFTIFARITQQGRYFGQIFDAQFVAFFGPIKPQQRVAKIINHTFWDIYQNTDKIRLFLANIGFFTRFQAKKAGFYQKLLAKFLP